MVLQFMADLSSILTNFKLMMEKLLTTLVLAAQ